MKKIISLLLILYALNTKAQSNSECDEKLLSTEIDLKMNTLEEFQTNFSKLKYCGLDAVDIEFFSNNTILSSIIISIIPTKEMESLTYGILLNKLLEIKNSNEYKNALEIYVVSQELSNKIATIENWEEDKIKLKKLDVPENEMDLVLEYIKENSNTKTLKEIIILLAEERKINTPSEDYSQLFANSGNVNFEDLLKIANEKNKPLLIYFSGYSCVNAKKIEEKLIAEIEICEQLKNQFYFVTLYVDDRTLLPESEQFISKSTGRVIKTIGHKNLNLQLEKFNVNIQPFFVVVDSKGQVIATESYSNLMKDYLDFIKKGLKIK